MNHASPAQLPDLNAYRQTFVAQGLILPLSPVPYGKAGLLAELPPPPEGKSGWPWTVETPPVAQPLAWPKISIAVPSYNQANFLEHTLRSVLLQNYPSLELIVCDGGSRDGSREILEKYSPWISFWQSQPDRGQGHAINLGFSLASGSYQGWLNSDDFYLPGCLQSVAQAFLKHAPDFLYGDALSFNDQTADQSYWQGRWVCDRYLRFGGLIASHAAFWRRSIHQPIWEAMHCNVDGELWIRMLRGRRKHHLRQPLGVYREQPQAKTAHEKYRHLWREDDEKIAAIYGQPPRPGSYLAYEFVLMQRIYQFLSSPSPQLVLP